MPQRTLAATSRVVSAGPAERDAYAGTPPPSTGKWTGRCRVSAEDAAPHRHDGVHRAPNRSGRGGAGLGWGGAGARP
jgi:hypothetical protein